MKYLLDTMALIAFFNNESGAHWSSVKSFHVIAPFD